MPENYSDFEQTGNTGLDMVAQAVGWAKKFNKPIKSVTLSRQYFAMAWAGTEILMQKPLPEDFQLTFEKIPIYRGLNSQLESITIQYFEPKKKKDKLLSLFSKS